MAGYPFVVFKMWPTANINSTPTLIFGNDQNGCILDGILVSNITDNVIILKFYILREVEEETATEFVVANNVVINANDRIDILKDSTLTLEIGDTLYAYSDFSGNLFNTFISYRSLTELTNLTS